MVSILQQVKLQSKPFPCRHTASTSEYRRCHHQLEHVVHIFLSCPLALGNWRRMGISPVLIIEGQWDRPTPYDYDFSDWKPILLSIASSNLRICWPPPSAKDCRPETISLKWMILRFAKPARALEQQSLISTCTQLQYLSWS